MANGQRGFRVLRDPQEQQESIRSFVRDPGLAVVTDQELAPAARTLPPLSEANEARRRRLREIAQARSGGGLFQEPPPPSPPTREEVRQIARERSAAGLRRQTPVVATQEAVTPEGREEAVDAQSTSRDQPQGASLRVLGPDVGPPSERRFEFLPGPGRGLRGEIEFEQRPDRFEERVRESIGAGAFDPVTPERVESARQVHQANLRALRGLRQLAAARRGVPEQFLDAVRQGHISSREANLMAAQQPVVQGGRGRGLSAADVLRFQQGEREQALRERQFAFDQQQEINDMVTAKEAPVRRRGRRAAAAFWKSNPDNQNAIETMSLATSELLNDLGNPNWFSALWADVLGGHPQALWDPDTNTSVQDVMARRGFEVREQAGEPVLFHQGNPVEEWDEIQSANKDIADFLVEYVRPTRRGFRQR